MSMTFETEAAKALMARETDHGPDNALERYYSSPEGGDEIVCTTDEREEFDPSGEIEADVLPPEQFRAFARFLINQALAEDVPVFIPKDDLAKLGFELRHSVWTMPLETYLNGEGYYGWNRETTRLDFRGTVNK